MFKQFTIVVATIMTVNIYNGIIIKHNHGHIPRAFLKPSIIPRTESWTYSAGFHKTIDYPHFKEQKPITTIIDLFVIYKYVNSWISA